MLETGSRCDPGADWPTMWCLCPISTVRLWAVFHGRQHSFRCLESSRSVTTIQNTWKQRCGMNEGTCNSYRNPSDAALFAGKVAGEPVGNVLSAADLVITEEGARLWSHHGLHPSTHGALWSQTRSATPSRSFDSDQSC